jgi:protein-S-isoprenylcysteine O-methyltransferase Ste14
MSISLLWHILFYGWTAGEVLLVIVTRTRKGGGQLKDRGSMAILWITIVAAMFAAGYVDDRFPEFKIPNSHWIVYPSLVLMIAGLIIRWTAIISLGKAFSVNVAIRDTQTLYQKGLYRLVRHPSYSGMVVCFVAIGMIQRNWLGLAVVLVPTTAALLYRIHVEEAALNEAFGAQYASYSRTTRRLIPGIY